MSETPASLIIAASESDSNLYYACRFLAPDPFVFLQVNGRKTLLMSDLEVDRARAQARVDEVLSLSQWEAKARQRWPQPRLTDTRSLLVEDYAAKAGSGPIRPNQGIIFDIFPRSSRIRYYADMTRTVVKGKASDELRRLYDAVLASQLRGIELIRDGASGSAIHAEVNRTLETRGFMTGVVNGRNQGFFHRTGHGAGLDIHELPRISRLDSELKTGHIVTVRPGLHYPSRGSVRIKGVVLM